MSHFELRKRNMPPMDASEVNAFREMFKAMEANFPESMAKKRKVLGV